MKFDDELIEKINIVDDKLKKYLTPQYPYIIFEAMSYSVFAGGKRLRPLLLMATFQLFSDDLNKTLPFACAMEMIHTYSLIHDDLPALDNDDFRRGKPTNHKIYGEAMAILAGDGLLNQSFEIMAECCEKDFVLENIKALNEITKSAGVTGMIGGQTADIISDNKEISLDELIFIHKNKTAKLIQAALVSGGILGEADEDKINLLRELGEKLGIAFQIKDDILDVTSNLEVLGKNIKSDENNNKSTYVSIFGLEKAEIDYNELSENIFVIVGKLTDENSFLYKLIEYLLNRNK